METQLKLNKESTGLGAPWEEAYGYKQAIKIGDTIYVSGQLSHDDEGNLVGEAPVNDQGQITDHSNMDVQLRQSYQNAKKVLAAFGATLDNVVDEVIYVTDMDAAFAVAGDIRKVAYGTDSPNVASTLITSPRLAFPSQLVEVKLIAKV